jgi:hypothetical protein
MLSERHALVTDFGVSKAVSEGCKCCNWSNRPDHRGRSVRDSCLHGP